MKWIKKWIKKIKQYSNKHPVKSRFHDVFEALIFAIIMLLDTHTLTMEQLGFTFIGMTATKDMLGIYITFYPIKTLLGSVIYNLINFVLLLNICIVTFWICGYCIIYHVFS